MFGITSPRSATGNAANDETVGGSQQSAELDAAAQCRRCSDRPISHPADTCFPSSRQTVPTAQRGARVTPLVRSLFPRGTGQPTSAAAATAQHSHYSRLIVRRPLKRCCLRRGRPEPGQNLLRPPDSTTKRTESSARAARGCNQCSTWRWRLYRAVGRKIHGRQRQRRRSRL